MNEENEKAARTLQRWALVALFILAGIGLFNIADTVICAIVPVLCS